MLCPECGKRPLAGRREVCGSSCRVARFRRREREHSEALAELLARTSEALRSGAPSGVVDDLTREAERLLRRRV